MRREIWTLGHVADVAQIALVDNLRVVGLGDTIDLAGLALVDQIEQRREGIAETYASPASVTNVEDAFELALDRRPIVEFRIAPVDRVACRRLETAFASCHGVGM